jgi:outer membrane PBP1 activator LpoA protein
MHSRQFSRLFLISFILLVLITGCETTPVRQSPAVDPQAAHAASLYEQQRYQEAADLYLDLANRAQPEQRSLYQMLAADSLIHEGQLDKAEALLDQVQAMAFSPAEQFRLDLVRANLALERHQPETVLNRLSRLPQGVSREAAIRYHSLRAAALKELQQSLPYARELLALSRLQSDDDRQLQTQLAILDTLTRFKPGELQEHMPDADHETRGWMELAALLRDFPNAPEEIIAPYREWRDLFPDHPALPELITSYYNQQQQRAPMAVSRIAVLLPMSGPYAKAASTIRDGLMAAWYADASENRPPIRFYDSSNPEQIWPLLNQAADQGASLVIGPLAKPAVEQLARAGNLPVPVLALNQVNTDSIPPQGLYQFALSPEDEARQVAIWAAWQGYSQPALLYPSTALGKRMAASFMETWRELGGDSIRTRDYDPNSGDYSTPVAELVMAGQRKAQLEKLKEAEEKAKEEGLTEIDYELPPRGIDFVFAIGNKQQMRQIRPMVQFHYAEDLPVFSTSRAWNGQISHDESFDLAGLMLPEMPWILDNQSQDALSRTTLEASLPSRGRKYLRLLPMGVDAYSVAPLLRRLESSDSETFPGRTGLLYLTPQRKLMRRMTWVSLQIPPRILGITPSARSVQVVPMDSHEGYMEHRNESPPPAQR